MIEQKKYDFVVQSCTDIISRVEQITDSYKGILLEDGINLVDTIRELDLSPFERSRSKIKSQLINIAVCGAFSSGKSFLISALIDRLEWYERQSSAEDIFEDQKTDGYITFLPTAPEQTNSCPLDVIPFPEQNSSRFEVMFDDTKQWEDKSGIGSKDDEIARKMLAYATDIDQWRIARPSQDIPRNVIRARLYVGKMPIPAIIHDLPGIGGAGEIYLHAVHEALQGADCIVYVASAIKELTDVELGLLRFVEEVSEVNKTPVFFVLSQIDREPDWQRVLDKNNQFLKEYFLKDGKANKVFIGKGFMPLSAGAEAKAKGKYSKGEIEIEKRDRAIEKSRMQTFRDLLLQHLTTHSGPAHLKEIVVQMHGILKSIRTHLANRMQAETVPLENADQRIKEAKELVRTLTEKNKVLLTDLEQLGKETLLAGFVDTDPDDLLSDLKNNIVPLINKLDVTKEAERDKIQQEIKKVRDQWLKRPKDGFVETWNRAWSDYQKQTIILLHERLSEAAKEAAITYPVITGPDPSIEIDGIGFNAKDTVEFVKVAWQISAGVATIGGGILASSGLLASSVVIGGTTVALGPIGLFLVAAGAMGWATAMFKKQADLKKIRKLLTDYIPKYSDQIVGQLKLQAQEDLDKHKGSIINIVRSLISVQQDQITTLENRLRTGDLKTHQVRIGLLQELDKECKSIEKSINDFYSNIAS